MIINCDKTDCRVCDFHHCGLHDYNKAVTEYSRPKGEWKQVSWKSPIPREIELVFHYKCDNCDKEVRIDHIERYNYCPHCGAYMRSEE